MNPTLNTYTDRLGQLHLKPKNAEVSWRISTYAFICNVKDEILMVIPTWNTKWELPGGGVEINECIKQAIQRECYEETGYTIKLTSNLPLYVSENKFFLESQKQYIHSLVIIWSAKLMKRKQNIGIVNLIEKNEISKIKWIKLSSLTQKNCHHIFWPLIKNIKRNIKSAMENNGFN